MLKVDVLPVGAGFGLLPPPRAVRTTVHPAAPITDPGEVLLFGDGPGFEILFVLSGAGERHSRPVVVLPGFVAGLPPRPEGPPGPRSVRARRRRAPGRRALRVRNLFGDGPNLLIADVRVVLDSKRDGEVRFVELVPEASQAANSADARPSHPPPRGFDLEKKEIKEEEKLEKSDDYIQKKCGHVCASVERSVHMSAAAEECQRR